MKTKVLPLALTVGQFDTQQSSRAMPLHQDTLLNKSGRADLISFFCECAPNKGDGG
jgi:hypothetical protein